MEFALALIRLGVVKQRHGQYSRFDGKVTDEFARRLRIRASVTGVDDLDLSNVANRTLAAPGLRAQQRDIRTILTIHQVVVENNHLLRIQAPRENCMILQGSFVESLKDSSTDRRFASVQPAPV